MSDSTGLIVILVIVIAGHLAIMYHIKYLTDLSHVISTGAAKGVSMSIEDRWATLRNMYISTFVALGLFIVLLGILDVLVARTFTSDAFRYFGYLHALLAVVGALGSVGFGALHGRHLASALRKAEAD